MPGARGGDEAGDAHHLGESLRRGVKFHTGDFNADAARRNKFSIERSSTSANRAVCGRRPSHDRLVNATAHRERSIPKLPSATSRLRQAAIHRRRARTVAITAGDLNPSPAIGH